MNENLLAISNIRVNPINGFGNLGNPTNPTATFTNFISSTLGLMTMIAAIWFLFVFLSGAYGIISSGGNKNAYEEARGKITSGAIGLIVVISASFAIDLIGYLIGFDLILNPGEMINRIRL
ncbi:MAG: hypothetical protein NZM26_04425 [Patescibacteria group bacterium]|nr:hypothetical protein [Patescibacteria group bacterium]